MNNQSYEEYMRAVLGYSVQPEDTYKKTEDFYVVPANNLYQNYEMEKMYPEVYKTIYPKVCNVCQKNMNTEITEEILEDMVNDVYNSLETEGNINFYIYIENRNTPQTTKTTTNNVNSNRSYINTRKIEERQDRQRNNALLDIIRILLLRELINRPERPGRPPFPHQGPRPPMPPTRPPYPGQNSIPRPF